MSPRSANRLTPPYLIAAEELRKNEGQWRAYESTGNCVLLAGPGSGKTKTLTVKMARMLAEDVVAPRGVACITYNNQCARELEGRLDALGVEQGNRVFIGTVHSFCFTKVVLPYAELAGLELPDPPRVAMKTERSEILTEVVETELGTDERPSDWELRMRKYRFNCVDRETPEWRSDERLAALVEAYEARLLERGLIDFDEMVLKGLYLVDHFAWVRKALRARYPVLVVDEYQDLGYPLHRLVLRLCFGVDHLVRLLAVGDPDQSIYGFNAARPELLGELADMDEVDPVPLKLNYRCGSTIIRASKAALGEDRDFEAGRDHEGTIDTYECPLGFDEQVSRTFDEIIPAALNRRESRTLGDIAVLYLNYHDGQKVADKAAQTGMNFIRIDSGSPYPRSPITAWLEGCAQWCAGGWQVGTPRLSKLIRTWLRFNPGLATNSEIRDATVQLVSFLHSHRDADMPLNAWLDKMIASVLAERVEKEPTLRDEGDIVGQLLGVTAKGGKLEGFVVATMAGQGGSPEHLNLMTLHSAKGSEFDVVIMMGMDQGKMPSWAAKTPKAQQEARRLFYVGLTRARHEVHMMYSGWNENRYGRIFHNGPSEFLIEVVNSLLEK